MKKYLFILLFFNICITFIGYSQPGPFGTDIYLHLIDKNNKTITPQNKDYCVKFVSCQKDTFFIYNLSEMPKVYSYSNTGLYFNDSIFIAGVIKTPVGGGITFGSHFIITHHKDTMILFPPVGHFGRYAYLDNIPFRKGSYTIPSIAYIVHSAIKLEKRKLFKPNFSDNWDDFRTENISKSFKTLYAECIEEYDESLDRKYKDYREFRENMREKSKQSLEYSNWFYDEYSESNNIYQIRALFTNKDAKDYNLLALNDWICFYQKDKNSPIEYGYIEVPLSKENISKYDSKGNLRFYNLDDYIYFNPMSFDCKNGIIEGYYYGKKQYDERLGTVKEMWGKFKIHAELSDKEIKRIGKKHASMNNLFMKEDEAIKLFKKH